MTKMMKIKYCLALSCVVLTGLASAQNLDAQTYKEERNRENMIVDVVADFDSGRLKEAAKRLDAIIASAPDDDAAHYYMGLVSFAGADLDTAEKELRRAVQLDSTNFWYRYRLASLYAMTDRQELTVDIYNSLLRDFPKKSEIYYDLVDVYMSTRKLEEALETIDHIDTVFGKSDMATMTKFDILCKLDRQQEAYALLEEYNKVYSSPQVLSVLGDYNMSMYNDSTALANYDEALDIMPGYAPALLGKAETLRMTRKYPEYFDTLNELVRDKDIPSSGKCDYLQILVQRSDPNFLKNFQNDLDTVISGCLEAHPGDSLVVALAGIYYYGTGREQEAKSYFRQNVDNNPESVRAAYDYAEAVMYMSEWEELSRFCKSEFEKFPSEYHFLEMSTLADYSLQDYDSVISTCERLISMTSDSTTVLSAYSTLGDMYSKKGENVKAYKAYDKALKINPTYLPVLNNYAYYLSMENKSLKKAADMSRMTIEVEPDNPTYLDTYAWILYLQGKAADAKPYFKHAMLYGGKDSAVILDHYADVLYTLGEYELAVFYWNQAAAKDTEGEVEGLQEKIRQRRADAGNRK